MQNYVGKRLDGRYEIREIIGVGGMAVVYKAYDNIDDRIVAVKILKEEYLANEEFRRRFKNESKAIAVLSHMNIVKVFDVSYGDRLQYIVMEYVEGITLKEYIQQQGVVNHREAVYFVMQVLRALQHAHDKGIVHRDIKPQNILLLENGLIKVTDFGIARFFASETRTMSDSAIGSVHYISPEQARGDLTNDKADIYSVGVMLYEMLTGRLPFESDNTVSVAIMQLQKDPVMPRTINPQIPVGLEQIIIKAMQKNVNDRYQSAAEMLLDLEEFRRNPSIKFDYTYANNEPTKYIPNIGTTVTAYEVDDDNSDYDEQPVKNRTIPILIGIIVALVVLIAGGSALGFYFGVFGDKGVKVPDFVGKEYSEEVFKEEYSDFVFTITERLDTAVTPNTILSQTPSAGERIDPEKTLIELVVATGKETVTIPSDLKGKDYVTVKNTLSDLKLNIVDKEVEYTPEHEEAGVKPGTVIDITPGSGEKVYINSTVTVKYLSYSANNVEVVPVPDVAGLTKDGATQLLKSSGFVVVIQYDYDDTIKNNYVIKSSVPKDTKIPKGSEIILTISMGEKVEQTTMIDIVLPDLGALGSVTASLDSNMILNDTCYLDGSSYTFTVVGHKADSVFKVFVNNKVVYKCDIDFTAIPCEISNVSTYVYEEETSEEPQSDINRIIMPDLTSDIHTPESATDKLIAAGFNEDEINFSGEGSVVIGQYPPPGQQYPSNINITLILGGSN